MFRRLDDARVPVRLSFEGRPVAARAGDTVAAALLASGIVHFRDTPVGGGPRGPWCMMGVCFDCLVEVDGVGNQRACQVEVAEGMAVRRQRGARAP